MTRLVDIRPGEGRRLAPLTAAYGLVLASVYVLKPARNALFLDQLGIEHLPYVLILVGLVGGVTASFYSRFTHQIQIRRLLSGTLLFLIGNLAIFWFLFPLAQAWIYYLFYVWVNLYGLMAVSLLWLLANAAFNPREARRLFGLIGAGGIAGAILGGVFTGWAAEAVGTENLLLVCAGLLGGCLILVRLVPLLEEGETRQVEGERAFAAVSGSRLLQSMGGMVALTAVVAAIADVQFNQIASEMFETKDAKTAFFGSFFAYLNGFAFLFQLLITPRILQSLGVGTALMVLPFSMGAGAICVLLIPGLLGGIGVKVGDVGFRHSVHKSATEILFLPIPPDLKKRAKVFLDTTVDNLATGVGAILVLVMTGFLGLPYRYLSFLSLGFILVWGWVLVRVRRAYVDTFREGLEKREIDPSEFRVHMSDGAILETLLGALGSQNERQVVYALELLSTVAGRRLAEYVEPLLDHSSAEVRRKAILALQQDRQDHLQEKMERLLVDPDPEVGLEAMFFLCLEGGDSSLRRLQEALTQDDPRIQASALGCIAVHGSPEQKALVDESVIDSVLERSGEIGIRARLQAVRTLGVLERPDLHRFLPYFMEDVAPEVVREAIRSAGKIGDFAHIPWLIDQLENYHLRQEAREALAAFGPGVLEVLGEILGRETTARRVRRNIVRVIGLISSQESVDFLMDRLDRVPTDLSFLLIKALSKLRVSDSNLYFDRARVEAALIYDVESFYEIFQIRWILEQEDEYNPGFGLLKRALDEHQAQSRERLFRLLGFLYPPRDMYHAYLGITSQEKMTRANALEFLENVLDREQRAYLFPVLDVDTPEATLRAGQEQFHLQIHTLEKALLYLIRGNDVWLRACALNCVVDMVSSELAQEVMALREDAELLVSETAQMVALRLQGKGA
ncbi:MAG: Npt1/Npt2 family nucleotide transporter [bacterium]|nr:Npt1/Npt2 family nucleotide transporter [bacterium]